MSYQLMDGVCQEKCTCSFGGNKTVPLPKCQDQPDDPKVGKGGPKYSKPIEISMFDVGIGMRVRVLGRQCPHQHQWALDLASAGRAVEV